MGKTSPKAMEWGWATHTHTHWKQIWVLSGGKWKRTLSAANGRGYRDQAEQRMSVGTGKDTGGLSAQATQSYTMHNYTIHSCTMPQKSTYSTLGTQYTVHCIHTRFNWNLESQSWVNYTRVWQTTIPIHSCKLHIIYIYVYIRKRIHWDLTWLTCVIVSALRLHWLMPCTGGWSRKRWWKLG